MKRRIRLTESQLYRLIENALNETDVRTKLHAAELSDRNYKNGWDAYNMNANPMTQLFGTRTADKAQRQRFNFMNSIANDVKKNLSTYNPENPFNAIVNLPYNDFEHPSAIGSLRKSYQDGLSSYQSGAHDPKNDMDRTFREYFQRKTYFKNGRWIDSLDDDWDEQECKEWWAKNGGLPNGGLPQADEVAESVIRKLRRL